MTVAENIRVAVAPEHLRRRDPGRGEGDALAARRRPLRRPSRGPRLVPQRRPPTPTRARQGVRRVAAAADPRRADGAALAGFRRAASSPPSASSPRTGRPSSTSRTGSPRFARSPTGSPFCATERSGERPPSTDISDDDLLALIIGRTLEATFPPKHTSRPGEDAAAARRRAERARLRRRLVHRAQGRDRGHRRRGRQRPARASPRARRPSAGDRDGQASAGKELSRRALLKNAAYMPADRLTEGLMIDLNVRENTALTALDRLTVGPVREPHAARSTPSSASSPSWPSGHRRSRRRSRRSPAATSRRS